MNRNILKWLFQTAMLLCVLAAGLAFAIFLFPVVISLMALGSIAYVFLSDEGRKKASGMWQSLLSWLTGRDSVSGGCEDSGQQEGEEGDSVR